MESCGYGPVVRWLVLIGACGMAGGLVAYGLLRWVLLPEQAR